MAFDFPNAPTTGQQVTTPNGSIFTWDGVKWTAAASGGAGFANAAGRNLVHNPLFQVAQRGVGPFTTSVYGLDRWWTGFTNGTLSTSQVALNDTDRTAIGDETARYGLQAVFTGGAPAASTTSVQHTLEDVRRTANKTITVSFWAKAASGTPKIGIGAYQYFGAVGSPSAQINITSIPVTISTTFARYSVTLTMPSVAGKTFGTDVGSDQFGLVFWYSSGSTNNTLAGGIGVQSGTFTLWGVQCEIGNLLTPLEKPDPRIDWANCLRFYQTGMLFICVSNQVAGGNVATATTLGQMHGIPGVVVTSNSNSNISGFTITGTQAYGGNAAVYTSGTATAAGVAQINVIFTASADL